MTLPDDDKMHNFIKKGESMGICLRLLFKRGSFSSSGYLQNRLKLEARAHCCCLFCRDGGTTRMFFTQPYVPNKSAPAVLHCRGRLVWPMHSIVAG